MAVPHKMPDVRPDAEKSDLHKSHEIQLEKRNPAAKNPCVLFPSELLAHYEPDLPGQLYAPERK